MADAAVITLCADGSRLPVAMEESLPPGETLVVERFISLSPHGRCAGARSGRALRGTLWNRVRLGEAPVAGTRMACANGMEQEQRFLTSLNQVERYRLSGHHLELLDGSGSVLARFEAAAPQ
jgi:hypothetical protein